MNHDGRIRRTTKTKVKIDTIYQHSFPNQLTGPLNKI